MRNHDMSEELRELETQLDAIEVQISKCIQAKKMILERIKKINAEGSLSALRRENKHLRDMVAALLRDKGQPYKEIAEQLGGVTTERARTVALNGFRYLRWTMQEMEESEESDRAGAEIGKGMS